MVNATVYLPSLLVSLDYKYHLIPYSLLISIHSFKETKKRQQNRFCGAYWSDSLLQKLSGEGESPWTCLLTHAWQILRPRSRGSGSSYKSCHLTDSERAGTGGTCRGQEIRLIYLHWDDWRDRRTTKFPRHLRRLIWQQRQRQDWCKIKEEERVLSNSVKSHYIWNWWQKRQEQMEGGKRRRKRIQISLCLPASGFRTPEQAELIKMGSTFLCRIRKGFRGIVSNQDFFSNFKMQYLLLS